MNETFERVRNINTMKML